MKLLHSFSKNVFLSILVISLISSISFGQEKKNPDQLDGFREFKFYSSMDDYKIYNLQFYEDEFLRPHYKLKLPKSESTFLGTEILELRLYEFKNQLVQVMIILKDDVGDIVEEMFEDSQEYMEEQAELYRSLHELGLNPNRLFSSPINLPAKCYKNYREPHETERFNRQQEFSGINTSLAYGKNDIVIRSYRIDNANMCTGGGSYIGNDKVYENRFYVSLSANDYEEKINSNQVKEHYDSYLSDFGIDHHPASKDKSKYTIPLFRKGNSYNVKVLFGNKLLWEMVLDTGADQFIIGNSLYQSLKDEGLVKELNEAQTFTNASGDAFELKKVLVKELQINDLKIKAIQGFVNQNADISLFGQSILKRFGKISIDHTQDIMTIEK